MTDPNPDVVATPPVGESSKPDRETMDSSIRRAGPTSVVIRPVPSIVFLWPTAVAALISATIMLFWKESDTASRVAAHLFFIPLTFNFIVISFPFSRAKVITLSVGFLALVLGLMYINVTHPEWLNGFIGHFTALDLNANAQFYFLFSLILWVVYFLVFIATRFNYWEITNNELIHHRGFLGDVDRYPAPNLRLSKEIDDVFQWMMAGSGRLVFYPAEQSQAIILDNVLGINRVENRIKELLSTLSVTMYDSKGKTV